MAWTAPMTAVDGAVFTAAQFNSSIRDNLLETAPAKATTAGGYFVATGANSIVQRLTGSSSVDASQTTLSTTFTDLGTVGPSVTVTTGTQALVIIGASLINLTPDAFSIMSVAVSGATTIAASDTRSVNFKQSSEGFNQATQMSWVEMYNLNPGVNTFTAKYRVTLDTGVFSRRRLIVIPL